MNPFISPVKLAIVGSRGFAEPAQVRAYVARLHQGCVIISGGARGVDAVAIEAAEARGLRTQVFLPDWALHGRRAGILRNRSIVEACERLTAFWDGHSAGTRNSIYLARRLGRLYEVVVGGPRLPQLLRLEGSR